MCFAYLIYLANIQFYAAEKAPQLSPNLPQQEIQFGHGAVKVNTGIYIKEFTEFDIQSDTFAIDAVIFNSLDFWEGRVSQGTYHFKGKGKTYVVKHELLPNTKLKKSTIYVLDAQKKQLQEVVLTETKAGKIKIELDKRCCKNK